MKRPYAPHTRPNRRIGAFTLSVDNETTTDYFTNGDWRYLIPALTEEPEIVKKLRSGSSSFVRIPNGKNFNFYVASRLNKEELLSKLRNSKGEAVAEIDVCLQIIEK